MLIPNKTMESVFSAINYTFPPRSPFFGREKAVDKILNALTSSERGWGVIIDGIGGIGKQHLQLKLLINAIKTGYLMILFLFVQKRKTLQRMIKIKTQTLTR